MCFKPPHRVFGAEMLFKHKKVVYSLAFFGVIYTRFAELECKQKLYDFHEDKNFKRSKVLVRELHKNYLKRSPKRQIRSANGDSWIADSNPENKPRMEVLI